ncbi:CTP synthase isoform X2 [Dermacentor variabilis]|uniref:CTP synthase isoform X2 n=1 Tax=Dermacentor variabilis TaxID=34621 RepID=UPI003F5B3E99
MTRALRLAATVRSHLTLIAKNNVSRSRTPPVAAMKYILVTGGVISGIGKGVIASSVGTILKACGLQVTSIKIDPYINIDAGTFSPYEHGEVYVLDDGGEVDLDLGNYERFLDITLHRDNNITTGKIYQHVINKERKGDYLGKTVQVVPHITDAIQEWVQKVALIPVNDSNQTPEVCIIELGGTIGDIEGMPFVEAFRQFQFRVKRENFCCVHVSLVPQPKSTGEHKTKPTQASVRELRGLGLSPDLIVCRSENEITNSVKDKISNFCHVEPRQVLCMHDVPSIYHVPIFMEEQGIVELFAERLHLQVPTPRPRRLMYKWRDLALKAERLIREVTIALVGKYIKLQDAYSSVIKALQHAALACNHKLKIMYIDAEELEPAMKAEHPVKFHAAWQNLCVANGIIVPGGFGSRGVEGKIAAIEWARKTKKPFLGVCLGLQCAVIEFSRNVLGWEDANSSEINVKTSHPVIIEMPEHNVGQMGGTMRLGKRETNFNTHDSVLRKLYQNVDKIEERHRHRYEVNPSYVPDLEKAGLKFVGKDTSGKRMEVIELSDHPYFVGVQFHPEYISRPLKPSPPYMGLVLASCGRLNGFLLRGCRMSPRQLSDIGSSSEDELHEPVPVRVEAGTSTMPVRVSMPGRESVHHDLHHDLHHASHQAAHGGTMIPGFSRSEDYRSVTTCNDDPDPPSVSEGHLSPPHCNGKILTVDEADESYDSTGSNAKTSKSDKSLKQRTFRYHIRKGSSSYGSDI